MRTYDTYKDSGISWLGQIPSHWDVKRAKVLFNKENRPVLPNDEVVTCFRDGQVTLRKNRRTEGFTESLKEIGYQGIRKGDLVIHQMDAFAGATGVSDSNGKGTPVYHVCTPKTDYVNNYYYAHIVRRMGLNGYIQSLYRGIRERSSDFRFDVFGRQFLPVPPLAEQEAIVAYLDSARKQIIINQAVTQGLNPDAPMKPTNINYIGNVPAHWQITQFKRGISKLTDYTANGSFGDLARNVQYLDYPEYSRLIRLTDLRENLKNDKCVWVNKRSHDYLSKSELFGGELLIANVGAYSGYSCIMPKTNLKCTLGPNMELIECNQLLLNEYASLVLNSKSFFNHLQMVAISSAQPKLNKNDIKSIFFLFPPIKEQEEIIEYIKITTKPIDAEITRCEQKIALLTERKQILINDVVTGKIKVL